MTEHELKCWPDFFDAVKRGDKTFELRRNDRGFQRGDVLVLRKWDPNAMDYTCTRGNFVTDEGAPCRARDAETLRLHVTYVLASEHMKEGHVALGFRIEASP